MTHPETAPATTVPAAAIKAALRHASKDATRYALCGVLLDRSEEKNPRPCLVAKDGHRLIRIAWDGAPRSGRS